MKPFIEFNTELRKKATTEFEQDLYEIMNNSVFGKTMENLRNRVTVDLVRGHEINKIRKLVSNPLFNAWKELGDDFYGINLHKDYILFNRPVYVGMCVLDLSKLLLYEYYYKHLKPKYGANCSLLYTDTDSLIMHIKCDDFYKDMEKDLDLYDTSNYPPDHPCYSKTNKKISGKLKDECGRKPIKEVVCLRSKMYSIVKEGDNVKKAKGTAKCVVKKLITHEDFKTALFNQKVLGRRCANVRSRLPS